MRSATAIGVSCSPARARRSRGLRSPLRSGGAGRRCRAPCRRPAASPATVRSATSPRIWSIARTVSASICLRVSSRRRWRSTSASSLARWIWASATLRASARMSADSLFACARMARFCSSSSRASLRALSASSTACRMRSRRASIVFWIGPNAYFLSTKKVIPNATSVQIMRPGTTLIRSLFDSAARRLDI